MSSDMHIELQETLAGIHARSPRPSWSAAVAEVAQHEFEIRGGGRNRLFAEAEARQDLDDILENMLMEMEDFGEWEDEWEADDTWAAPSVAPGDSMKKRGVPVAEGGDDDAEGGAMRSSKQSTPGPDAGSARPPDAAPSSPLKRAKVGATLAKEEATPTAALAAGNDVSNIRAFDLGGSGLKTALFHATTSSGAEVRVVQVSASQRLGWVPAGHSDVAAWLLAAILTLNAEATAGWGFGLCYAEPSKLWEERCIPARAEGKTLRKLFGLERLQEEWDGDAHFRAACYARCAEGTTESSMNFSLGTGFAVAACGCLFGCLEVGMRSQSEFAQLCGGVAPFKLKVGRDGKPPTGADNGEKLYVVLGGKSGWGGAPEADGGLPPAAYAAALGEVVGGLFLASIPYAEGWGELPAVVTFTGGVAEHKLHPLKLRTLLRDRFPSVRLELGPVDAGLLGAALKAAGHRHDPADDIDMTGSAQGSRF